MTNTTNTLNILTHNGVFHADEVLAIALIKLAFPRVDVKITRGRDIPSEGFDVVVDVNGEYKDNSVSLYSGDYMSQTFPVGKIFGGRFDHHQFKEGDDLYGKSSAGLILVALTRPLFVSCETGQCPWNDGPFLSNVSRYIKGLVDIVDKHDCGIEQRADHPLIKLIQGMNDPEDVYGETQDKNFKVAVNATVMLLQNMEDKGPEDAIKFINHLSSKYIEDYSELDDYSLAQVVSEQNKQKREEIQKKIDDLASSTPVKEVNGVKFIIIQKGERFVPAKFCIGRADFVVNYDKKQEGWGVTQIPLEEGKFGGKFSLDSEHNVQFQIFTHKGGFFGIYKEQDLVPYPGEVVGIKIPVKEKIYIDLVIYG
jgi:uncharacterized UPF0160 family protein